MGCPRHPPARSGEPPTLRFLSSCVSNAKLSKLYREYNQVSFWDLWKYERKDHSVAQICFMGLPSFIAMQVLRWSSLSVSSIRSSKL